MAHFFRTTPDFISAIGGSWYATCMIGVLVVFLALTLYICKQGRGPAYIKGAACLLLLEEGIKYAWFILGPYLVDPLPLYHCRLAMLLLPLVALFPGRPKALAPLEDLAIDLALFGSLAAYLSPSIEPFVWPHFTNISFYLTHALIGGLAIALIWVENLRMTGRRFLRIECAMALLNLVIATVGHLSSKNYGFFLESPLFPKLFASWPSLLYDAFLFGVYGFFAALAALMWYGLNQLRDRIQRA